MLTKRRRDQSRERGRETVRSLADRQIRDTRIDAPCLPEFAIASSVRSASTRYLFSRSPYYNGSYSRSYCSALFARICAVLLLQKTGRA